MAKYRFEQIAINSKEKKKPAEEDRFTYLGLEHLDSGSLRVTRFGSDVAPIGEKLVMHKGDVLFGKRRAYQKKVAIAPFDGIFSAHGMVLRPREEVVDKDFFPLFISSDYFLDAAIKISVGSLSPTINWRDLKELEFELPDLDTQRGLAKVLWSINDTIDVLCLKINGNRMWQRPQCPSILDTVNYITGKARNGLCNNHIDFASFAVIYHLGELLPVFDRCCRDALISVDAN